MNKSDKQYFTQLKAILGMFGVRQKDAFLNKFLKVIEDKVADQFAGYFKQLSIDALAIMMQQHGYGKKRWQEFEKEYRAIYDQLDIMSGDETMDNFKNGNLDEDGGSDIPYMKAKVDEAVKPLYEGYYLPYDERYRKAQQDCIPHNWDELRKLLHSI